MLSIFYMRHCDGLHLVQTRVFKGCREEILALTEVRGVKNNRVRTCIAVVKGNHIVLPAKDRVISSSTACCQIRCFRPA